MRRFLFIILALPFIGFGQQCDTIYPSQYADTIIYCVTDATCHDICDGTLVVDVRGVNQPYSFSWTIDGVVSPFVAGDNSRDSLCANQYIVSIIDGNGDPVNFSYVNNIFSPPNFTLFENLVEDPSCNDYSDGEIDLIVGGATPPYSFLWDDGTNTVDRNSLQSGTYVLTINDVNGCTRVDTFILENPNEITSITASDTLSCVDACDGIAMVVPSDGVSPYTYQWSNGDTDSVATNLCFGISTVIISGANGCLDTNFVEIVNPDTLKLSNITVKSACFQTCDGQLAVTIEGGESPYNTEWSLGHIA